MKYRISLKQNAFFHNFFKSRFAIILLFILISSISISNIWSGQILGSGDFIFHMSRIETFKEAIQSGSWFEFRNFTTFNQIGNANIFFYPYVYTWLCAIPFVIIKNPINAYYLDIFLITLITLFVTYYSYYSFKKNKLQSILIAVIFTLAPYKVFLLHSQSVMGEAFAYTFIPLFFLGLYRFFSQNNWWTLSVALALTLYAHLLTLLLEILLTLIIFIILIFISKRPIAIFFKAIKSGILFSFLTAFFWIPFLIENSQTKIQNTSITKKVFYLSSPDTVIKQSLNNGVNGTGGISATIGLFCLSSILLYLIFWKKLNIYGRISAIIGTSLLLLSTSLLPWYGLPFIIQNTIQFPYRLYGLATFALIFAGIQCFDFIPTNKQFFAFGLTLLVALSFYSTQLYSSYTTMSKNTAYTPIEKLTSKNSFAVNFKLDKKNFSQLFRSPRIFWGTTDYAPISAWKLKNRWSLITHKVLINNKVTKSSHNFTVSSITYRVKVSSASKVDIPILHYGNETVLVNGKQTSATQSKRSGTLVNLHSAGTYKINVSYPTPTYIKILFLISLICWTIPYLLSKKKLPAKDFSNNDSF